MPLARGLRSLVNAVRKSSARSASRSTSYAPVVPSASVTVTVAAVEVEPGVGVAVGVGVSTATAVAVAVGAGAAVGGGEDEPHAAASSASAESATISAGAVASLMACPPALIVSRPLRVTHVSYAETARLIERRAGRKVVDARR